MGFLSGAWDFVSDPFDIFHDEDPDDPTLTPSNFAYVFTRGWTESAWRAVISQKQRQSFLDNMRRQDAEGKIPIVTAPVEYQGSWEIIGEEIVKQAKKVGETLLRFPTLEEIIAWLKKYGIIMAVSAGVVIAVIVLK